MKEEIQAENKPAPLSESKGIRKLGIALKERIKKIQLQLLSNQEKETDKEEGKTTLPDELENEEAADTKLKA